MLFRSEKKKRNKERKYKQLKPIMVDNQDNQGRELETLLLFQTRANPLLLGPHGCFQSVAAFAVSAVASQWERTGKPFNPLLGETYELIR